MADVVPGEPSLAEAERRIRDHATAVGQGRKYEDERVLLAEYDRRGEEIGRLRLRSHEIQAQEMAKRSALDSELAEWRTRHAAAKQWTEDLDLTADWAPDSYHPFWSMTSYNMRSTLLRLVSDRDALRVQRDAVLAMCDAVARRNPEVPQVLDIDEVRAALGVDP